MAAAATAGLRLPLSLRLGWRNLWRNRRRTALTAGGVAFAIFLVVAAACLQLGSYQTMEETATSLLVGHLQIERSDYADDPRVEATLDNAAALMAAVARVEGVVAVTPRLETFGLASAGERSFGAQVLGIDPVRSRRVIALHERVVTGRYLDQPGEAVLGVGLARNLGVRPGDEIVVLGSARQGGVAALVVEVTGLLASGIAELDRALLVAHIDTVRDGYALGDAAHKLVVRVSGLDALDATLTRVRAGLDATRATAGDHRTLLVRGWPEVLPELRQAIEVDRMSSVLFYWFVMLLVAFSVINTFIMTVFERTREFGMLLAIGMRPLRIIAMLLWEAAFMWLLGCVLGLALASALVAWLAEVGIYLGADMERLASQMYLPTRLYPAFTPEALLTAPLVMLAATQIAALLPGLRIRRLAPVDALRVAA